jgi:multidrug efflux pump subunit AcrA (membrane-fusion protein)
MLQPFEAKSSIAGTIVSILPVGSELRAGALLARLRVVSSAATPDTRHPTPVTLSGDVQEFRAPVDGEIASLAVKEGDAVSVSQTIASLKPDKPSVSAALRALAYVGTAEDLPLVESLFQPGGDAEIATQASTTAKAIRSRAKVSPR